METKESLIDRTCLVKHNNNFEGVAVIKEVISITAVDIKAMIKFDGVDKLFLRRVKLAEVLS